MTGALTWFTTNVNQIHIRPWSAQNHATTRFLSVDETRLFNAVMNEIAKISTIEHYSEASQAVLRAFYQPSASSAS